MLSKLVYANSQLVGENSCRSIAKIYVLCQSESLTGSELNIPPELREKQVCRRDEKLRDEEGWFLSLRFDQSADYYSVSKEIQKQSHVS